MTAGGQGDSAVKSAVVAVRRTLSFTRKPPPRKETKAAPPAAPLSPSVKVSCNDTVPPDMKLPARRTLSFERLRQRKASKDAPKEHLVRTRLFVPRSGLDGDTLAIVTSVGCFSFMLKEGEAGRLKEVDLPIDAADAGKEVVISKVHLNGVEVESEPKIEAEVNVDSSSRLSGLRKTLSFTRKRAPKASTTRLSLDVYVPPSCEAVGISLAEPAQPAGGAVAIADLRADSVLRPKLEPGDLLHAINGHKVSGHKEAASLLRKSRGVLLLEVTRHSSLPEGWEQALDEQRRVFYVNRQEGLRSSKHPRCKLSVASTARNATTSVLEDRLRTGAPELDGALDEDEDDEASPRCQRSGQWLRQEEQTAQQRRSKSVADPEGPRFVRTSL